VQTDVDSKHKLSLTHEMVQGMNDGQQLAEAVFQMMMLSHNLFLLFKFDSLSISGYKLQIRTFRLKDVFLALKIIRTENML
jgi:hypothetical protein